MKTMVPEDDVWRWMSSVSAAVDPMAVAVAVAEVGADAAGASFANLAILDRDSGWVRIVHGSSLDEHIAATWAEFPISSQTPLCEAMETGLPVLLGSPETIAERYPNLLADTLAASLAATASFPVHAASGAILGATGFAWPQPQEFGESQVERLGLVARLAGLALDRALLHERELGQATAPVSTTTAVGSAGDPLTPREVAVLQLLVVGHTNAEIANLLGVSLRTIESTRSELRQNLGLRTRSQLVRYARETGLADPNH